MQPGTARLVTTPHPEYTLRIYMIGRLLGTGAASRNFHCACPTPADERITATNLFIHDGSCRHQWDVARVVGETYIKVKGDPES